MLNLIDESENPLPCFPARKLESHKGDYGRALVVGGSRGMAGAVSLTGMAALRTGAGLVTLAVPNKVLDTVAQFNPCVMTYPLDDDKNGMILASNGAALLQFGDSANAWAVGPGLGCTTQTSRLVCKLYRTVTQPMVVDADGLNALAMHPHLLAKPAGPRVLTPHVGELARLVGRSPDSTDESRIEAASLLAAKDPSNQTVVVLKGHRTVICDGKRFAINTTGNPGMSTAGAGDCLTGIITALICQSLESTLEPTERIPAAGKFEITKQHQDVQLRSWEAARLGVYLHGKAGDLAAEQLGQASLIATDLIEYLPKAIQQQIKM